MRNILTFLMVVSLTLVLSGCGDLFELVDQFLEDDSTELIELEEPGSDLVDSDDDSEVGDNSVNLGTDSEADDKGSLSGTTIDIDQYVALEGEPSTKDLHEFLSLVEVANEKATSFRTNAHLITESLDIGRRVKDLTIEIKTIRTPFIQNFIQEVAIGPEENVEWYATDEALYVHLDDYGWLREDANFMEDMRSMLHETIYIEQIVRYEQYFELREDDDHYIVVYTGPDELYEEIFMNDPIFQLTTSGQSRLRFSKDSYLLQSRDFVSLFKDGITGELVEVEVGEYYFSYNDVEPFEVPQEVIESAVDY